MNLQKQLDYIKQNRKLPKGLKLWELFELQKLMKTDPDCDTYLEFELEPKKNEEK